MSNKKYAMNARRVGSHECDTLRRLYPGEVGHLKDVDCTMLLNVENAYLHYGGPKENYRPYLVLSGFPVSFEGEFPGNVTKLTFDREIDREPLEYVYELSRRNLSDMAAKGLYEPGFEVPDVIKKNEWYLPVKAELYHAEVDFGDDENHKKSALIFIRPQDGSYQDEENSLTCGDEDMTVDGREIPGSGYTVHKYFEPVMDKKAAEFEASDDFLTDRSAFVEEQDEAYEGYLKALDGTSTPDQFLRTEDELSRTGQKEDIPVQEDKPVVDPEVYASMKETADAMFAEREQRRLEPVKEGTKEDLMPDEPEESPEKVVTVDEPEGGDFLRDDDEDDESARARRQTSVFNNKAENIDTMQEVVTEGLSIQPGAAQLVNKDVIDKAQDMIDKQRDRKVDADFLRDDDQPDVSDELGY